MKLLHQNVKNKNMFAHQKEREKKGKKHIHMFFTLAIIYTKISVQCPVIVFQWQVHSIHTQMKP